MALTDLLPTAILVPSLNRPQNIKRTAESIHRKTPEEHFILWCVSDDESKAVLDELGEWYLDDSDSEDRRYVTRMNRLLEYLDDAETVFFASDDVLFYDLWLGHALKALDESGKSVAVVNDRRNVNGTQAVVRRGYLERAVFDHPGLAFWPDYEHNFADNEMFAWADKQGELIRVKHSVVEHLHPVFGSLNADPWDEVYRDCRASYWRDQARFKERYKEMFAR